jgi:Leucine-rich repeat (LRR) protein
MLHNVDKRLGEFNVTSKLFQHTPNLEELKLSWFYCDSIEPEAFANLNKLKRLYLNDNELPAWPFNQCKLPASIEHLDLSNNLIESIEIDSPDSPLPNLLSLVMLRNYMHSPPVGSFPSLVHLDLCGNNLMKLEYGCFEGLSNLRSLDLSENQFESLDFSWFDTKDLANLRLLNLENLWRNQSMVGKIGTYRNRLNVKTTVGELDDMTTFNVLCENKAISVFDGF